ncbi:hypothetical protein PYW07_011204 [Mythimna separata]|uniref:Peptidase S1 domain-containing protein n=1 Tax=Mythimna separata TaxID=271217 RepID=A0AAD7Y7Z1_MYTSE|nr:hypothetical protein PYW07_011204 [Mythimna separata]
MSVDKHTIIVYLLLSCFSIVLCELNLDEDEPCVTKGLNGTCKGIFRCNSAALVYLYANAGYDVVQFNLPELPDICSYKNNVPVVCCTDCKSNNDEAFSHFAVGPLGVLVRNDGPVASRKCLEYFSQLPYPCRGQANFKVKKIWKEDSKCHKYDYGIALAVGGRDAQRWEFPHSALLGYGEDVESAQWLCGGSVISERFILTAAHCTSTKVLGSITFAALGLLKRTDPKKYWKIHKIKRIIIHPDYKAPSKYHDIALIETETEINFGKDLLPACLDVENDQISGAEASGWGRLGHKQNLADILQVVYLEEYDETECATIYQPHRLLKNGYDHEKQMCFGNHREVVDTCEGDSGGPLQTNQFQCQYTIVGVTSYGKDCGILGSAGMYTRVSYYVPWIESVVWPEETEAKRKEDNLWLDKWLGKD